MRLLSTKIHIFLVLFLISTSSAWAKPQAALPNYKKSSFNLYSPQDEVKLGEQFMAMQIKALKKEGVGVDLPRDQKLKSRIEKIVKQIAVVSDGPNLPYEIHIFDKPDVVNAFCMPGGKIGVFTGLFDKEKGLVDVNNDAQIAAVIGHEMAHATLRHVTRNASKMQGLGLLGSIASVTIGQGVGGTAQAVFDQAFSLGANLYLPKYSRSFEQAADQAGFYYMSRAGFDPTAAIQIWKRAAARGGRNSEKTSFFASHPANGERARALEKWLPEAQKYYEEARAKKR